MIGKKLKSYRLMLYVTGETLANLAGIKRSYLSQIENEKKIPPLDTFLNLITAIAKISPLNFRNENYILTEKNCNKFVENATIKAYEINDYPDKVDISVKFEDTFSELGFIINNNNSVDTSNEPMEPFRKGKEIDSKPFLSEIQDELRYFFYHALEDQASLYENINNLSDTTSFDIDELCLYSFSFIRQSLFEWWYNEILKDIMLTGVKDSTIYVDKEINKLDKPLSEFETSILEGDRRLLSELWPLMNDDGTFTPNNDDNEYSLNISKELLNGKKVRFDLSTIYLKETILSLDGELLTNKEKEMLDVALGAIRYFRDVR